MTLSGWFAVSCWGIIVFLLILGLAVWVGRVLRERSAWYPEPPDFRYWLEDWGWEDEA